VQLHQPRNSLAIDTKTLCLQLQGHAPIPIIGIRIPQLMQP
jgi:hypothetical protein